MNKVKRIIKTLSILFLGYLAFLTGQTVAEKIKIKVEIKRFIEKGVYETKIETENGVIKFYKVPRETYYQNELEREPFFEDDYFLPGSEGDIFVTSQSPFPTMPGIYELVSFYFGGHASYIGKNNSIYEIFGFIDQDESFLDVILNGGRNTFVNIKSINYWLNPFHRDEHSQSFLRFGYFYRSEWIGLRVKGVTNEEINSVTSFMNYLVETKAQYNHLYIFGKKNKYYCTDMMSRAYSTIIYSNGEPKYNLNMDGFLTTVNDLILSNDTYISYYVKTDKKGITHVYYVG